MIFAEINRFQHKKCIKTQNFERSKIDINHLQDLKNIIKSIFNGSRTNFAQNHILKNKIAKFAKKY